MANKKYTDEQMIRFLEEADAGKDVTEICRQAGITKTTFYRWKAKLGGMTLSDAQKLRRLEDENLRLKRKVADLTLDLDAAKDLLTKKF
jgi:putative transposase